MVDQEAYFQAEDGLEITYYIWKPVDLDLPKGVVQLTHGMAEHMLRYEAFARYLTGKGYIVYGHDQRGHGRTAKEKTDLGFFATENGSQLLVDDAKQLTEIIRENHPNMSIILFGHSMGSFIVRRYTQLYGQDISGAVICATGGNPGFLGWAGIFLAKKECRTIGEKTPSPLLNELAFGNFNKPFRPNRTPFDWLSRDEQQVDAYVADPLCGNVFTARGFLDLFTIIQTVHRKKEILNTRKNLPLLFIAGTSDPVGKNGFGVKKVFDQYKKLGMTNVTLKLYEDARHEILNEVNREEVFGDMANWIDKVVTENRND